MMQSEKLPRRIRIQGKPGDVTGHWVLVTDLDTGEVIPGIVEIDVHLSATGRSFAHLRCYETNAEGQVVVVGPDEQPVEHVVTAEKPEVDVTAEHWV